MMRTIGLAVGGLVAVLVLLWVAAASGLVPLPGRESTSRPRCEALPTSAEVAAAIEAHPEVTAGLRSAADGVHVSVSRPCSGTYADRALVAVAVPDDGRDDVTRWLDTHDGYGVPIDLD
jgi:hypothetical protein